MRPARSLLLVPAHAPDALSHPASALADAIILDFTESLPATRQRGREILRERISEEPDRRWWVRSASLLFESDIDGAGAIEGVVLTGIRSASDVVRADQGLAAHDSRHLNGPGSSEIIVELDNARSVFFAHELATTSRRVGSFCFNGAEHGSLNGDLACSWSIDGPELMFARQYALVAARAADMDCPLDGPFANVGDLDGLARDSEISRRLGYRGRIVLDPTQIEIVNRTYSPTADEVAYHRRVLAALDAAIADGRASVTLDGKMIDYAHAATARSVIDQARAWGIAP